MHLRHVGIEVRFDTKTFRTKVALEALLISMNICNMPGDEKDWSIKIKLYLRGTKLGRRNVPCMIDGLTISKDDVCKS